MDERSEHRRSGGARRRAHGHSAPARRGPDDGSRALRCWRSWSCPCLGPRRGRGLDGCRAERAGAGRCGASAPARRCRSWTRTGCRHGLRRVAGAPARCGSAAELPRRGDEQGLAAVRALPVQGPVRRTLRADGGDRRRGQGAARERRAACRRRHRQRAARPLLRLRLARRARVRDRSGQLSAGRRQACPREHLRAGAARVARELRRDGRRARRSRAPASAARAAEGVAAAPVRAREGSQAHASGRLPAAVQSGHPRRRRSGRADRRSDRQRLRRLRPIRAGDTGAGVHIGIYEQEPFATADVRHFDSCYFGAAAASSMGARLT